MGPEKQAFLRGRFAHRAPRRQKGLVLIVVVAVLTILLLAGLGVMRAADTGSVIAGNFSFQQAAMQASDRAVSDALVFLKGKVVGTGGNTTVDNQYLNTAAAPAALNDRGMPTAIDWSAVACVDPSGATVVCATDAGNYRIQYVVERRCSASPTLTDIKSIRSLCEYEATATATTPETIALRYRILIHVLGPRGTEAWYEVMVSGPVST